MNPSKAKKALKSFVEAIEVTGGVVKDEAGLHAPAGDEEWIDLGDAYLEACAALGREPKIEEEK